MYRTIHDERSDEETEALAERVYGLRYQRGWSQIELSRRAGVTQATISSVENARRAAYMPTLRKIAGAFGLPTRELLMDNPDAMLLQTPQDMGANSEEFAE